MESKDETLVIQIKSPNFSFGKPKWWNKFIGQTFEVYKKDITVDKDPYKGGQYFWYYLTENGRAKLGVLIDEKCFSALVYPDNATEILTITEKTYER